MSEEIVNRASKPAVAFVIVRAFVPTLADIDARQRDWRRKHYKIMVSRQKSRGLAGHCADGVGLAGEECTAQEIRDPCQHSIGPQPRQKLLFKRTMRIGHPRGRHYNDVPLLHEHSALRQFLKPGMTRPNDANVTIRIKELSAGG